MPPTPGQMVLTFPPERGPARATLRVASFPSMDRVIDAILPRWNALHPDVAIELGTRRIREHHEALIQALTDPALRPPDVVGLSMDYLGQLKTLGLEELDPRPRLPERWADRLAPYAVEQARGPGGRPLAMPADIGPGVLFFRADVLERAGVTPAELGASWESFIEAGRRLKAATGASLLSHPFYLKECFLRSTQGPGEGLHFSAAGEPLVTTPRYREAFRLASAARAAGIDLDIGPGWTRAWMAGVRDGAVAGQLTGTWFLAHLSTWLAPETRGLWRTCAYPGPGRASMGGAFYAIPRLGGNKELALDFIRLACLDREVQLSCFRQCHAFPALIEAQDAPFFDEPLPFLGGQPARRLWQGMVPGIRAGPVHPLDHVAEAAVNDALRRVLEEGAAIDAALAEAERAIRARLSVSR